MVKEVSWSAPNPRVTSCNPVPVCFPLYQAASWQGRDEVDCDCQYADYISPECCVFFWLSWSSRWYWFPVGVCFVFQSWGSEIHVSHADEVGQSSYTPLFLWPISLTCLASRDQPLPTPWLLSWCVTPYTAMSWLHWMAIFRALEFTLSSPTYHQPCLCSILFAFSPTLSLSLLTSFLLKVGTFLVHHFIPKLYFLLKHCLPWNKNAYY